MPRGGCGQLAQVITGILHQPFVCAAGAQDQPQHGDRAHACSPRAGPPCGHGSGVLSLTASDREACRHGKSQAAVRRTLHAACEIHSGRMCCTL